MTSLSFEFLRPKWTQLAEACGHGGAVRAFGSARLEATLIMMDLANYSATETLRDGRTVEIRALRSQDRKGMQAAIARSSSGALYRRFFAVRRELSETETDSSTSTSSTTSHWWR